MQIRILLGLFLFVCLWSITACSPPSGIPVQLSKSQSNSPLIPGNNAALVANFWRLVEVTDHGKAVAFADLAPVYVTFHPTGILTIITTTCNAGGYHIVAEDDHRYHLIPGDSTAKDCGKIRNLQSNQISEAVGATTAYEIKDHQLFLTGDNVQIVLEIANPP